MTFSIEYLPIEIQDKILSELTNESLLNASKVCRLWFILAGRNAKNQVQKDVLPEIIHEVQQEVLCHNENLWLQILNYHCLQLQLKENLYTVKEQTFTKTADLRDRNFCSFATGCHFYVSNAQEIQVYDAQVNFMHIMTLACGIGPIKQIVPVPRYKKILVLSDVLEVYDMPSLVQNNYEMNKLTITVQNYQNDLINCNAISADDVLLAVQSKNSILVMQMNCEQNEKFSLRFLTQTETSNRISQFSLWMNEIIILLETGEILCWPLNSSQVLHCGTYQEIRYRNPVWLLHGRIFCSTLTSRVLLGLWHLEAGTSYWLVGRPIVKLFRCRNLDPVVDGVPNEISSLCLKFRLLICGTNEDSLYRNENQIESEILESEFNRKPDAVVKVCDDPIEHIVADFSQDSLYIMLRFRSRNEPVSFMFCRIAFDKRVN